MLLRDIREALLHLLFPHVCEGCGRDVPDLSQPLCLRCLAVLPETGFHLYADNPVERIFQGRLPVRHATAQYYFTKGALVQRLMHQFKYKGDKELGSYLGKLMGTALAASNRFKEVDLLIPLPLYKMKEKQRGFNQAAILCAGIAEALGKPVCPGIIFRTHDTETQTRKGRVERWQNMAGRFALRDTEAVERKHVLLVDDVVTTGASLEACGREILMAREAVVSIATLCYAMGN